MKRQSFITRFMIYALFINDFGLEELVPSLWIESEREYDISAAYGIAHWWFSRKQFYINKHSNPSDRDAVRSHMRFFTVIGKLDHLPKQDKVHLHNTVNLWTRNIVIRKRVEDLQLGIESYQTKLNLEQPNWDASDIPFFPIKEDYPLSFKPRAVIYRDMDDNRKMMRINEVHKFSDGTLTRIKEKLDFMVKDFKLFKFNKGMENRKWTEDDKRRSEDFIEVIERRLKIRRIFRSTKEKSKNKGIVPTEMELVLNKPNKDTFPFILSFTHCGNKVILRVLRIILVILPEHPSDTKDHLKMEMEMEIPSVKASANSDIIFFFTSAQDGNKLLDDERLSLADDLKKAHDQNQNKSK
ncbi:hypothetical protein Tco_0866985 [Tanacetum coccineum]